MDGIYTEVRQFVEDKVAAGVIVRVDWLTSEYIGTKSRANGEDMPFYRHCAHAHLNEVIRRVVGKYDACPVQEDRQLVLDGFEHLQRAYTVQRDGVKVLVPIDKLSDEELAARADEYDAMAKGCRAHAREIRKFVKDRSFLAAAE